QSAFKSCQHLLGLRLGVGTQTHQEFLTALKTARCMRAHGYPNWPDPQANAPGVYIPPNVDMNAPQFRAVAKTCGYPVLHGGWGPWPTRSWRAMGGLVGRPPLQWRSGLRAVREDER